jgi:uncharacterized protein (TIGR03435 family)
MTTAKIVIVLICAAGGVFGQSAFEVASVKPSAPDVAGMFIRPLAGGGLQVTGASLRNLISLAYDVRPFQVNSESSWIDSERFDIDARAATPADPADVRRKIVEGLKSLLADRFQLVLHSETKEQAVYLLLVNKGGSKLQESTEPTGLIRRMGRGTINGHAVAIRMLAINLSNELGRGVIDQTGLAGKYDFELKWGDPDGPSIFTALQEQLGLHLESGKGPVEVLVIDRAARPSKN